MSHPDAVKHAGWCVVCQPINVNTTDKENGMMKWTVLSLGALLIAAQIGCYQDRPHEAGQQAPPTVDRPQGETGLGSKDVVAASDQMAQDLLAAPDLNASHTQWLMVVDKVENRTTDNRFSLDIFLERLKVNLAKYGKGRVQLIENRDKLRDMQSRELEQDQPVSPGPKGIQPDYALYGRIMELPNRGASYYLCEFTVTDLRTRQVVWTNAYEVKVAR
ncbi:MAG: hypothetical protein ACREJC_17915 [Tepidisphaeraceae bacterium]